MYWLKIGKCQTWKKWKVWGWDQIEKANWDNPTFSSGSIFLKIFFIVKIENKKSLANQFSTWLYYFSKVLNKNYCFVCNALNYSLKYYYHVCYKKRKKVALISLKNQQRSWEWCHFLFLHFPHELMKKCVHTKGQLISEGHFGVFKSPKKANQIFWRISALAS